MAHCIEEIDTIMATSPCWHNKENLTETIKFPNSGLDWEVGMVPAYARINGEETPTGAFAITTEHEGQGVVLGNAKSRYAPIQNRRIWELKDELLSDIPHEVTCSGSLQGKRKVFISCKFLDSPGFSIMNAGRKEEFLTQFNFLSSHDTDLAFECFDSTTRVVCMNTFNAARSKRFNGAFAVKVRHTLDNEARISAVPRLFEAVVAQREELAQLLRELIEKPISLTEAELLVMGHLFPKGKAKPSKQLRDTTEAIVGAFQHGDGNRGKNRYDLFNGVTQYYTRDQRRNKSILDSFASSEVGLNATHKGRFFDVLTNDDETESTIERGREAMALLTA